LFTPEIYVIGNNISLIFGLLLIWILPPKLVTCLKSRLPIKPLLLT
jgi:flagellar biosynthesis protein FliR